MRRVVKRKCILDWYEASNMANQAEAAGAAIALSLIGDTGALVVSAAGKHDSSRIADVLEESLLLANRLQIVGTCRCLRQESPVECSSGRAPGS